MKIIDQKSLSNPMAMDYFRNRSQDNLYAMDDKLFYGSDNSNPDQLITPDVEEHLKNFLNCDDSDLNVFLSSQFQYEDIKVPINCKTDVETPIHSEGPPPRGDFAGDYNFKVQLSNDGSDKKQYRLSTKLNRVYLKMLDDMPVEYKWNWTMAKDKDLCVRATPILAGSEQLEARVLRCHNHRVPTEPSNRDFPEHLLGHVLRSTRQADDVIYCGDESNDRQWLSVVAVMDKHPPKGSNVFRHVYRFCCKHSCTSGINRRRIEVLFTLEDVNTGVIYGRSSLGVRVCSCPKRDLQKEESEYTPTALGCPPTKRLKIARPEPANKNNPQNQLQQCDDIKVYNVNFQIMGTKHYLHIMQAAYNAAAAQRSVLPLNTQVWTDCSMHMAQIQQRIDEVHNQATK